MIHYIDSLFATRYDRSILGLIQRRVVQALAVIGMVVGIGVFISLIVSRTPGPYAVYTLLFVLFNGALLAMIYYLHLIDLAGLLLTVFYMFLSIVWTSQFLLFGMLTLAAAALLLAYPLYVASFVVMLIRYVLLIRVISPVAPDGGPSAALIVMLTNWMLILLVGLGTRYLMHELRRAVHLGNRISVLLQATTEVGQAATNIRDLQQLFNRTVELIQDRFGFYHVQVFVINGDQAELVASTGKVGERLLASRHRLTVGSNSVVGRTARDATRTLARDTDTDAVHRANPLLPQTRAELAVPLLDADRVIGVLDMQSTQRDAFQPEDIDALELMASLLAAAIRNVSLFESRERSAHEQERLYQETETNLREIQRLNQQLTRSAWDHYIEQAPAARGITLHNDAIVTDVHWDETLIEAAQSREAIVRPANGQPGVVAVPVVVRGEVIGAMEVELDEASDLQTSVEMLNAVADRLATSLENARLFEEARAATAQEQMINQLVTQYQSSPSVDDLLRITLTELSGVLGAQRSAIRLGRVPDDNGGAAHD